MHSLVIKGGELQEGERIMKGRGVRVTALDLQLATRNLQLIIVIQPAIISFNHHDNGLSA